MASEPRTLPPAGPLILLALGVAIVTAVGSVYLSLVMGLVACPLCFYQRAFALAAVGVLGIGVYTGLGRSSPLSTLTLPLAVAGLAVAGFHVWLEQSGRLECPNGIFGLGTAPQQSLVAFAILTLVLLSDAWQELRPGGGWSATLAAFVLGGIFALASVLSAPKLPDPPKQPYQEPMKGCRPPYVEAV